MSDALPQTERRRNHIHAAIVNAAISLQVSLGRERAIALLLREQLPQDVIDRVMGPADQGVPAARMTRPHQRLRPRDPANCT